MRAATLALLVLLAAARSEAIDLVATDGFEAPTFTPGTIEGQNGWLRAGNGQSTATVIVDAAAAEGDRSLLVQRAASDEAFWAVPLAGAPSGRFATVQWDMTVVPTGSPAFGPFFGVSVFDETTSGVALVASLGVDATTGDVLYQAPGTGEFVESGVVAIDEQWSRFEIIMDFQAGVFTASVDGVAVATNLGFVDASFGIDGLTDADITAVAAFGDPPSLAQTGVARFDNFVVIDGLPTVPGDFSGDGRVDNTDLNLLLSNWGQPASPLPTGWDGAPPTAPNIDNDELNALLANWGVGTGAAVPEPGAVALVCGASLAIATRRA